MSDAAAIQRFRRQTARRPRADATDAERRFWKMLRAIPVFGSHFRRQVAIGPYVADFACLTSRLIVEIDGSHHAQPDQARRDDERTEWLNNEGYRVLRFWNNDLIENPDGVLDSIYAALYGSTSSDAVQLKHDRRSKSSISHPTPARHSASKTRVNALVARRPSPSRGG